MRSAGQAQCPSRVCGDLGGGGQELLGRLLADDTTLTGLSERRAKIFFEFFVRHPVRVPGNCGDARTALSPRTRRI